MSQAGNQAPRIQVLSDEVIGKIAAGEVVERPSAAIKELIENSLDAGATRITVEIKDGGITYFRVTDNGRGIPGIDIRMAFERHATSKIRSSDDLSEIATMGFRGEALSSIAAVSRMTCTTKTMSDTSGIRLVNEGGVIRELSEAACPEGTTMVVKDLFFNAPVRLKFLKRPTTEAGYVSDVVMHAILSRPDVSFRLISQGKSIYHSPGDGDLESAAFCIFGKEMLAPTTRKVHGTMNGVLLDGYVGVGESGRGNRNSELFFINRRYLQSRILSQAVEEGCRERVMIGKYPMCVLHLTMAYDHVDVNVHPNKLEVRFQKEDEVISAVRELVRRALTDTHPLEAPEQIKDETAPIPRLSDVTVLHQVPQERVTAEAPAPEIRKETDLPPVPGVPQQNPETGERAPSPVEVTAPVLKPSPTVLPRFTDAPKPVQPQPSLVPSSHAPARDEEITTAPGEAPKPEAAPQKPLAVQQEMNVEVDGQAPEKPMRLIGSVFDTYILLEYEDQLIMIDQHAAHERLNFDRMMATVDTQRAGQELLIPLVFRVTPREMALVEENAELLRSIGLTCEPFGEGDVSIRSIPMILGEPQTGDFFREILDEMQNEARGLSLEKRRTAILQSACKHAVKGGEKITEADMRHLVEELVEKHVTPTCPHGRPLVVALSHHELDRKFRRIQPT
ncbi:MAG: DNA mismatch repair endonuclease MutL [Clostridia bacterium]|nr:DNA mismatch repair endonuclease MutL [Clostridia bacterium]